MNNANQTELIEILNKKGFKVVDGALFSPSHSGSIWFHYPENKKAEQALFAELSWDGTNSSNFPITDLLREYGWFAESYDSETLFAYKI